jgi:Mg-chelatase subunit ChlD
MPLLILAVWERFIAFGRFLMSRKSGYHHLVQKISCSIILFFVMLASIGYRNVVASSSSPIAILPSTLSSMQSDFSLTSPVSPGESLRIVHGYNDPKPDEKCTIGVAPDHCNNQKYGLDLKPSDQSDKIVYAPLPGKINWMDDPTTISLPCMGILTDDKLNLTICHFGTFAVGLHVHDRVKRGQILGERNTSWIHLNIDDRYDSDLAQKPKQDWVPLPFSGIHTIEGKAFEGLSDSVRDQHHDEIINTGTQPPDITPNPSSSSTSTALVFDVSGSMSEMDPSNVMKLDAAKAAGGDILDIIAAENQATNKSVNQVALVAFSSTSSLDMPLTTDMDAAKNALAGLAPESSTAMPAGLQTAIQALANVSVDDKPIVILLSDGMPNVTLSGVGDDALARQDTLDMASQAGKQGICIYAVGFGNPAGVGDAYLDEAFLKQVVSNSGCGSYYNAQDATELANVYVQVRHSSTGNILFNQTGNITQGQRLNIGQTNIPANQALALFTLNWPGSRLEAELTDPNGQVVNYHYPGVSISTTKSLISIILQNPMAGTWKFGIIGADIPEGVTKYNAVLSVRPSPIVPTPSPSPSSSSGVAIVITILAGGGVFMYALTRVKRNPNIGVQGGNKGPYLVILGGLLNGKSYQLADRVLIGRGSACTIQLPELSVSRQHARIRFAQGIWFIQDLQSTHGTFINNQRISATKLKNGDLIRIGSTQFIFRIS